MTKQKLRQPDRALTNFSAVGIGVSAGGLQTRISVLEALPTDAGLAFVIIQYLDPRHESLLPELFDRSTRLPVCQAKGGMLMEPNHVYLSPPDAMLRISKGPFTWLASSYEA